MARRPSNSTSVRPIAHLSLVDRVTDELHRAILNGDIAPGSAVSIVDLCEQFAVSHIPVREALRRLESEGLLSLRPGRSALVASLSVEDLSGIYRLRKLIEGDLAERVAGNLSEESLAETKAALEEYAQIEREPARLAAAHHAFHGALLADVAGSADFRVLTTLWKSSDRYLHLLINDLDSGPEATSSRIGEHQALLDLAQKPDGSALRDAWVHHLDSSEQALLEALAESDYADSAATPH
ncbi:GntR family transcriptional regulator [Nocardioides sp.]|uniref:GntR family transcriptional regulator n=1 Tax=Nocardioides sp. TaxID=35761 RepID=UPI0035693EB8